MRNFISLFESDLNGESAETFPPRYSVEVENEGVFISMRETPDLEDAIEDAKGYVHKGRTRVVKIERSVVASYDQSGEEHPDDRWS